jgi:hypothetical protein
MSVAVAALVARLVLTTRWVVVVTNRSGADLEDVALVHGDRVERLGRLPHGGSARLVRGGRPPAGLRLQITRDGVTRPVPVSFLTGGLIGSRAETEVRLDPRDTTHVRMISHWGIF